MSNPFMKKWLSGALCALALGSTAALAEPDSFGLGDGHNGARTVTTANTTLNSYAQVTGPLAPGDTSILVGTCAGDTSCFAAGDLIMVLQTTGLVPEPASGTAGPLSLNDDTNPVGRWEFARLASVTGSALVLTAPLVHSYAANVTQVIKVPEYTDLTITGTGRVTALAWNGSVGGVIAFLANGTVTVNSGGQINASGAGFRGGQYVDDSSGELGCLASEMDRAAPQGAQKGEGVAATRYVPPSTGRGNVANGAGGGVCYKAGGGGGGNAGAGGQGGHSEGFVDGPRPVGGLGGVALAYTPTRKHLLLLGGGGGAGHGSDTSGLPGGRGGGIIFIRANQLAGAANINASGGSGGAAGSDGGSGGGAGGSVYLRFVSTAACNAVSASGGIGGNVNADQVGPGGGGGGGWVLFQSAGGGSCAPLSNSVAGANPGIQKSGSVAASYGAQTGNGGTLTPLVGGFVVPSVPTVLTPAHGTFINNPRPIITGTTSPSTTVIIYIDGVAVGQTTSDAAGNYAFVPTTDLSEGSHSVQAATEIELVQSARSTGNTFTVDLTPPNTLLVLTPPSTSNSTSATFDFNYEGTETGTVTYQCKLDTEAAFTPCPDPKTYTSLGEGPHTLLVRAVDAAGNVDSSPARYDWTVDTLPPDTKIVSNPPSNSNSKSATFSFDYTGTETGSVTYECKLDTEADFTACSNPKTYADLGEGEHTLQVRAVDATGNVDASPASYTWTVDTLEPTVSIVSGPSGTTREASATFGFDSNEAAKGVTYLCRLDAEADYTPCPNPKTYTGLGEGEHTLSVIAVDAAGNRSAMPAVRTWTVDTTPPDTRIVSGPASLTRETSATFDFDVVTLEAGVTYECKLDTEADFSACPDPKTYGGLGEGTRTLQVRAVDAVGNVDSTPASYTWTVDTVAPAAPEVSSTLEGATFDTATPPITGTAEPGSTVTVIIDGVAVGTTTADAAGSWNYTPTTPLSEGSHEVKARATDPAGNDGPVSGGRTFTIQDKDTMRPETTITSGPSGSTPERSATFEFGSNEPGVTYECSLDGAAYTPCTSPVTFNDLAPGEHTLQVRARDAAGNEDTTPDTRTWTVTESTGNGGGDISFRGDGFGCSATGGDSTLVLMGLGTFLALARRRRRN
jgi:large repetitive protein